MSRGFRLALCLLLLGTSVGCEHDSQWPARPVTLLCPWSAGGGTDRVARQIAYQLKEELGVPVNVVNATGGGGVTGHTRGATARPDGYTLTMITVELNMLHWRGLCPITPDSYQPLAKLNQDSAAIFVRSDASWQSIVELEDAFHEAKQPIPVSGSAAGSIWHLALVGWLMQRDVPVEAANWISINGSAPSLQELLAGGVEVVCCSIPEAASLLDAGEVRCLGVMRQARSPAAPEVPTFREQNVDWSIGGWRGLAYPRGVPEDRVERMEAAILKVARSDEFAGFMIDAGFNISISDGATFRKFMADSDKSFGDILTRPAMQQRQVAPLSRWFVPVGLAVLMGLVAATGLASSRGSATFLDESRRPEINVRLMCTFALSVALFIVCSQTVGYVIASSAMMSVQLLTLRVRWSVSALIVVVAVPGVYQMFAGVLGVPLPWGWLGW